jgi:hypothetical protein
MMMTVDADSVHYHPRVAAGRDSINRVPLTPVDRTLALGRASIEWRANAPIDAIRQAVSP